MPADMRIAFDAKRAFQNSTGLGHYSRTLISSLAQHYPQYQYYLMAPKATTLFDVSGQDNVQTITPTGIGKTFRSLWRSNWVKKDLKEHQIELYHGLSHELPVGIQHTGIRSVVTMHDLIFERYPEQYNSLDITIYRKKFRYACTHADHIIAISGQTKQDLVDIYKVPADKISVCYQSCDPIFEQQISEAAKNAIKQKYNLPDQFLLSVGSIIERKNLLNTCKAYRMVKEQIGMPLVVIGSGNGKYARSVKEYIHDNGLEGNIIFLAETPAANESGYRTSADFPAIYQSATALLYPSFFEGFGIPVLEALWSGLPVITSSQSCLPEAGGDSACYVNPASVEEIATAMQQVVQNDNLRNQMIEKGYAHARKFDTQATAASVMKVYQQIIER